MPSTGELAPGCQRVTYRRNGQAICEHGDTGVYFIFDMPTAAGGDDADDAPSLAFNLNYARPGCFALEAAPELEALLARFAFDVEDPQIDGMDDGPYTREGFLRGLTAGNDVAVQAFLADARTRSELLTLPAATIQRVWEWNRARKDLQARLGDDVFVPKISYVVHGGGVQTAAVWADGIPLALPPVEQLVLARDRLAPRRFLRRVEDVACARTRTPRCSSASPRPATARRICGWRTSRRPPRSRRSFARARRRPSSRWSASIACWRPS
jgi:hypothetical protein